MAKFFYKFLIHITSSGSPVNLSLPFEASAEAAVVSTNSEAGEAARTEEDGRLVASEGGLKLPAERPGGPGGPGKGRRRRNLGTEIVVGEETLGTLFSLANFAIEIQTWFLSFFPY